jgi:hypothetical protein
MSRTNAVESKKAKEAAKDTDVAVLSAQISNRFARQIDVFVAQNKGQDLGVQISGEHEPLLLGVKADVVRASVAELIKYSFEPWELDRKDSSEARKATNTKIKSQAALAEKLMAAMEKMGLGDQLAALLAETNGAS